MKGLELARFGECVGGLPEHQVGGRLPTDGFQQVTVFPIERAPGGGSHEHDEPHQCIALHERQNHPGPGERVQPLGQHQSLVAFRVILDLVHEYDPLALLQKAQERRVGLQPLGGGSIHVDTHRGLEVTLIGALVENAAGTFDDIGDGAHDGGLELRAPLHRRQRLGKA